ncbi:MAG: bifunctional hydroxymethylpyrimidine kinase/phosphomethylpyrimidine kinase [Verrucomicrobia bacterium]|jgi:hydroxymethylpyrimidine/phosphomethylpyrimidine kinase|nr:bifunctional hydroxymethylpyrimidine kinase/phosphomethylpyrimidine kinase [Verrucomicrobiota bacterium]
MHARQSVTALTIAGSDSGGGAGIQADLKVFNALGVHGTTAITCLTCQNPREVRAVQAARPDIVRQQIEAVLDELRPDAVKTGMLYSAPLIRVVADLFESDRRRPLIVDPVMVATSGATLLQPSAIRTLQSRLLPLATLVTPNLDEAAILTGQRLSTPEDLRQAARAIRCRFGCAVLVKGGHLKGLQEAVDIFWDGTTELLLTAPFIRGVPTHGTGCTYSAAITAFMAKGLTLREAVTAAKIYVSHAIARSHRTGRHWALGHGATLRPTEY